MHTIEVNQLVLEAEEGLLLGNGDLSVSVYQRPGELVWRFGKNDVWDRRLDMSDSPEPAHIEEIAKGIGEQGWKGGGYDAGGAGTDAGGLATGISLALVNTLLGLGLAIIGLGFFGLCRNRVDSLTVQATVQVLDLLEYFRPVPTGSQSPDLQRPHRPSAAAGKLAPLTPAKPADRSSPKKS